MAEVLPLLTQTELTSQPRMIPGTRAVPPASVVLPPRSVRRDLDVFSPVNQNGSFDFDRVLRSGEVHKRSRKTKQWKRYFLVLRPHLLSIYKNASEEKLHKQISLSDLTAVATLKDPKGKRENIFGLFSPSRNYQFQANSSKDAAEWVGLIRQEARIEEEEQAIFMSSLGGTSKTQTILEPTIHVGGDGQWDQERLASSSPEPSDLPSRSSTTRDRVRIPGIRTQPTVDLDYSGNELGSQTDFSDSMPTNTLGQSLPEQVSIAKVWTAAGSNTNTPVTNPNLRPIRPDNVRTSSQNSLTHKDLEEERVIWHGYLLCLKSQGGVRQWKKLWAVIRSKNIAFYKTEEEYAVTLLIPLSSIISAVEIDPISRSKAHCMQIIVEEKSYRFCALSEEALARCLGAVKSQLAKRKEASLKKASLAQSS